MFTATSRFVVLNNLNIKMAECSVDAVYDDPAVTINYVPLILEKSVDQESNSCDDKYRMF